ncbi:magnesium and cobalt efflux protein CorC [mine drainage metagenome]|uniref:Magnesium and cobalt efflux protein CorC n=1 Tax=mine drainage metagenome TaxID=410659 RepID=A0A1J5QJV0_9ZZZZ
MTLGDLWGSFALVLFFILLGGLFVAAEISLLSLRESQLKALAGRGGRGARVASLAANPNRFLAAAQVGVTVSGFLSAALGAERFSIHLRPTFLRWGMSSGLANATALLLSTLAVAYVSLVIGELVPKRLALQRTEQIALAAAPSIDRIASVFRPFIWLLSKSTDLIVRMFGFDPKARREEISGEELIGLVSGHAALTAEERGIVEDVFSASDRQLHEIMVPRTEVDFLDYNMSIDRAIAFAIEKKRSRYPVMRGSSDEIAGFIHVRDLLDPNLRGVRLGDLVRDVVFLPGTKRLLPALSELRAAHLHLAIVLDEYGGTDGIVTLEDIVEQLIGDIRDEYDTDSSDDTTKSVTGEYQVDGLTSLEDLVEETGFEIPEGPYETVAGFVLHRLGRMPIIGDEIVEGQIALSVLALDGRRISRVQIRPAPTEPELAE